MKKLRNFSKRGLAWFLSLVMCLSLLPGTAMAAEAITLHDGAALITKGMSEAEVKDVLAAALVEGYPGNGVDAQDLEWEYYCKGTGKISTNNAWGSINGFESTKKLGITYTFQHPALWDNADADYKVRLKDTSTEVTLTKGPIKLNQGQTIVLVYKEGLDSYTENALNVDWETIEANIFKQIVTPVDPNSDLSMADVTLKFKGAFNSYLITDTTAKTEISLLAAGNNEGTIEVTCEKLNYSGSVKVKFTNRAESSITIKEGAPFELDNGSVESIFAAVVEKRTPADMTWRDVEISGYDASKEDQDQEITISYKGSPTHKPTSAKVTVKIVDKRPTLTLSANGTVYVTAACASGDVKQQIANALTKTLSDNTAPEINVNDLDMTYKATLSTGDVIFDQLLMEKVNIGITEQVSITEGGDVNQFVSNLALEAMKAAFKLPDEMINELKANMRYPAIGAGTHEVTVNYTGSAYKSSGPVTVSVQIDQAPANISVKPFTSVKQGEDYGDLVQTGCTYCNGGNIGKISVYAGIDSGANLRVFLDLGNLKAPYVEYVINKAIQEGGSIQEIIDKIKNVLPGGTLPGGDELGDKIGEAIWSAIEKAISNGMEQGGVGGLTQPVLDVLNKIKDAIGNSGSLDKVTEVIESAVKSIKFETGKPADPGVYGVTGIVIDKNHKHTGLPGAGLLVIRMETAKIDVAPLTTVNVNEDIPNDMINSYGAPYIAMYGGMEVDNGLGSALYVEFNGLTGGNIPKDGDTITLGELRKILISRVGLENQLIEKLLAKMEGFLPDDNTLVTVGRPSTAHPASYAVAAVAAGQGQLPAVGVGTLTIVDKDMYVVVYTAEAGKGTVRLDGQSVGGPVVSELVPSASEPVGAYAEANKTHHFVKWTRVGFPNFSSTDNPLKPGRPDGLLSQIPGWITSNLPGLNKVPDLGKVAAIYVANFEEHKWEVTEHKDPTCTEPGFTKSACACGEEKTDVLPATGHSMELIPGRAPNCATDTNGLADRYHCTVCEKDFKDPNGSQIWNETDAVIPFHHRTETSSITPEVPATCLETGIPAHWECVDCRRWFSDSGFTQELGDDDRVISALGHNWKLAETTPSACEDSGVTEYHCSRCDAVKRVTTAANGHTWDNGTPIVDTGSVCGDATAMQYTCTVCGAIRIVAGDKTVHTPVDYESVTATCTTDGHHGGSYCSNCNAELKAWIVDPAHHTLIAHAAANSTCTVMGNDAYWTCDICKKFFTDSEGKTEVNAIPERPLAPHNPVSNNDADPATCVSTGWSASTSCLNCKQPLTGQEKTPVNPANHANVVADAAVPATCEGTGLTAGSHCAACNTTLVSQSVVSEHGHNYVSSVTLEPTETTEGIRTYTCTYNPEHTYTEPIAATGTDPDEPEHTHSYTASVTAPTCTAQGYTTHTCSCGDSYVDTYVSATGHSYTSEITRYPTAYQDGERTYTCGICGNTYTESIPATGITYPDIYPGGGGGTYPGGGSSSGGGGGAATNPGGGETISDNDVPLTDGEDILDDDVPLAGVIGLNKAEHFAYIQGYEDGTVRPLNKITRAEVATIFFRLMTDLYRSINWATDNSFTDTNPEAWYNNAVSTAAKAELLLGYTDGSFRPNDYISRAEFVTIAVRFLGSDVTGEGVEDFSDTADKWFSSAIRRANEAGWLAVEGDEFRPDEKITRADVIRIINRMLDRVPNADGMLPGMKTWSDNPADAWYYAEVQEASNDHAHNFGEEDHKETWTELTAAKDWKALEAEWAASGSASADAGSAEGESK